MATFIETFGTYSPGLTAAINEMNDEQQQVCRLNGGLAAIIGVPGSGKTRALVNLLARSVADGLDPSKVLAMTFTRAAAAEMNTRLEQMGVVGGRVGTIHSVCRQILIEETQVLDGMQLDTRGALSLELKKCLSDLRRERKIPGRGVDKGAVVSFIGAAKARGCVYVDGDPFALNMQLADALYEEAGKWVRECKMQMAQLARVYTEFERRRAERALYGFDDMLLWAWLALISSSDARARWRARWDVIITDETQDSNPTQWDIARMLVGLESCILRRGGEEQRGAGGYIEVNDSVIPLRDVNPRSMYVFGDSSQSLYKFRAAVPELFVEFACSDDVEMLTLPLNYRSTPAICSLGTALVAGKAWHLAGEMVPAGILKDVAVENSAPQVELFGNEEEEASSAVRWAMELSEGALDGLNDCAILSRTSMALQLCEIECIRARIPYRRMFSGSFFDSKETKDVLAYLQVACGKDGDGRALRRTINSPFRFISRRFIDQCARSAGAERSLMDEMLAEAGSLSPRPQRALQEWADLLVELNGMAVRSEEVAKRRKERSEEALEQGFISDGAGEERAMADKVVEGKADDEQMNQAYVGPAKMMATMLRQTDYLESLRREEGLGEEGSRVAMLGELQRMAEQFISPLEFLNYIEELRTAVSVGKKQLGRKDDDARQALTLSTIHRAKGLEWAYVRVIDVMEGRFPHRYARDQDEELRLLYVAVTRAKSECVVTATGPGEFIALLRYKLGIITGTGNPSENSESSYKSVQGPGIVTGSCNP